MKMGLSIAALGLLGILAYAGQPLSPQNIYKTVGPSVVSVTNMAGTSGGTGFTMTTKSGKLVIVTNHHVCERYTEMMLNYVVLAKVIERDFEHDLCLLDGHYGLPLEIGQEPRVYDDLYVVGHPYLNPKTPTQGNFLGEFVVPVGMMRGPLEGCPEGTVRAEGFFFIVCIKYYQLGQTTVPTHPGNSGSPIVNNEAQLVGIINSGDTRTHNGGFVPVRHLRPLLDKY